MTQTPTQPAPRPARDTFAPTVFLAWLSHPEDGGHFDQTRLDDPLDWRKHGPLHLSLHTTRRAAEAALVAACRAEWDRSELAYAHGPWDDVRTPLDYMRRHIGYDLHVTEQPVHLA